MIKINANKVVAVVYWMFVTGSSSFLFIVLFNLTKAPYSWTVLITQQVFIGTYMCQALFLPEETEKQTWQAQPMTS